ncbi:MAG: hypothetical protein JWQ63_634 [Mucilaginibacter sp.]|nr:hypothetical protein [Mucilaginibacter sp.]
MTQGFDFLIANDDEHEELFIEIYYNGKHVASIDQENGFDDLEIEFPGPGCVESLIIRKLPLKDFLELVNEAAKRLA